MLRFSRDCWRFLKIFFKDIFESFKNSSCSDLKNSLSKSSKAGRRLVENPSSFCLSSRFKLPLNLFLNRTSIQFLSNFIFFLFCKLILSRHTESISKLFFNAYFSWIALKNQNLYQIRKCVQILDISSISFLLQSSHRLKFISSLSNHSFLLIIVKIAFKLAIFFQFYGTITRAWFQLSFLQESS